MDQKFAAGDKVNIAELEIETGVSAKGVALSSLKNPGVVKESREHPPHVVDASEAVPSPHCLVVLKADSGDDVEAWFTTARLSKVG